MEDVLHDAAEKASRKAESIPMSDDPLEGMPHLVIVSGMSGAGRTEAMHVFEDMGYFCVDNLPSSLLAPLLDLPTPEGQKGSGHIAVVCDARNGGYFEDLSAEIKKLDAQGMDYKILFLDASDDKLIARYKSSRRRHPLCDDGSTIGQGIARERSLLAELKVRAHHVIDTTDLLPSALHACIRTFFAREDTKKGLSVTVYSFGFKHGAALDADIVMDVRFLPNPYYDPEMRTLTGLDGKVRDYVLYRKETEEFLQSWKVLLDTVMPGYVAEGKQQLGIAIGCTGGQHRSVVLAEATGEYLKFHGYRVSVAHRDLLLANSPA